MRSSGIILVLVLAFSPVAADTADDQLWRWVDASGLVTYSNQPPPAQARDVTTIVSRWAADESRPPAPEGQAAASRRSYEESYATTRQYDNCLSCGQPYPHYVRYTPYTDCGYSRRINGGPRRHGQRDSHRKRHYYQKQRRYERDYFSSSYRYRANLPQYGDAQSRRMGRGRYDRPHMRPYPRGQAAAGYGRGFRHLTRFGAYR